MKAAWVGVVAYLVAWLTLAFLLWRGLLPAAHPTHRSLHRAVVARGAGLGIWAGVAAAILGLPRLLTWLLPLGLLVAVSLWDDWRGVPALLRLGTHLAAALLWVVLAGPLPAPWTALVLVLAIAWMANLYNFMDGSDGLAAAMTLIGYSMYAIAGWHVEAVEALLALAVAAATVPFLIVNWPPARAFLGDVGAVPLGFLAAAFGIEGWRRQWWPAWFPALVFLPFIADATATLLRRLLAGERVWEAHRDHHYQRLVRLGFGHSGTLALYSALMLGSGASALAALVRAPASGSVLLTIWMAALLLLFAMIDAGWRTQGRHR